MKGRSVQECTTSISDTSWVRTFSNDTMHQNIDRTAMFESDIDLNWVNIADTFIHLRKPTTHMKRSFL